MISAPSISALTAGISLSAWTQARTKKPMKPSLTPCFFSNRSRYCARSAMTWLMSTSLKVVSMAAVFCASLSRRAMVWRSRVMRTRSSRAASSGGVGARTCHGGGRCRDRHRLRGGALDGGEHVALGDAAVLAGAGHGRRVHAGFGRELAHRRGERRIGGRCLGGGRDAAGLAAAGCGVAGAAAFGGASALRRSWRRAPAPSLIWPSNAPTATVSPSFAAISPSTPAAGAGTSIVTLSVSSSTSGSSTATASPGFLNHLPMVASVTDSPRVGTRISAMRCLVSFVMHPRKRMIQ